jgi:hypothetical protein
MEQNAGMGLKDLLFDEKYHFLYSSLLSIGKKLPASAQSLGAYILATQESSSVHQPCAN